MPVPASSALDRATTELRLRIERRSYRPGSALPPSAALAEELGVGLGTIRQALLRLDAAGLTLSRRGSPRIVLTPDGTGEATHYEQVAAVIRRAITEGELPPGTRLPAETALAQQHAVSRSTVRQALHLLEAEQHVVQRSGRRYVAGAHRGSDLAYEQLAAALRRRIRSRRRVGQLQLPGELALAAEFGVSRPTVRKALELLRDEGLVHSQPKVGWFATPPT